MRRGGWRNRKKNRKGKKFYFKSCADRERKLDSIFPRVLPIRRARPQLVAFLSRLQVSWHVFCAASGTWTSLRPSGTSLTSVLDRGKVPLRVEGARKTKCFSKKLVNVWPILHAPLSKNVPASHFSVAPCKTEYLPFLEEISSPLYRSSFDSTGKDNISRLPCENACEKVTKLKSWRRKFSS